jgi:hypothetical protein
MNNSIVFKLLSALFFVTTLVFAFFWLQEKNKKLEVISELEKTDSEKTQVTSELENMLFQYEDLKTNNDSLNLKLESEQEKIKQLLKEIKQVKYSNKLALEQYKKETETLRAIMRSYIIQIDSLNTMNQNLLAENKEVKNMYQEAQEEKEVLLSVTDSLSSRVAMAEQLLVKSLFISGLNKRDNETNRVERIEKFKTCFSIKDNKLATKGKHLAYIRISMPDKSVLYESEENLFNFKGDDIVYTAFREFDYQGTETELCIYYKHVTPTLVKGTYHVDIFIDGERVNSASFELL